MLFVFDERLCTHCAYCCRLSSELNRMLSHLVISKSVLQALIAGSGVNWAQYPDLIDTIMLCGQLLDL